jgi:hypothetical protein
MNEQQIRAIIRDEMLQNANSGTPITPRHIHDGTESPKIPRSSISTSPAFSGSISMSQGTITGSYPNQVITWANYYIPTPSYPVDVKFYGGALDTTDSPKAHALITGSATLVIGNQYQPGTVSSGGVKNSVTIGNVPVSIIQGCSALVMYDGTLAYSGGLTGSNATSILRISQQYIAFASDASSNIYAVAKVASYNNSRLTIQTAFASNWSLTGQWIIS